MVGRAARLIVIGLVLATGLAPASPAFAAAKLLKRATGNVLQAPVDAVMAPYTFTDTFVHGMYLTDRYSVIEKVAFTPIWGVVYLPACTFVSAILPAARFIEGMAMLPVGLATARSDYDVAVWQPMPGKRMAVVNKPPVYLGTRYCEGFFQ
jgi:hypothetical protein